MQNDNDTLYVETNEGQTASTTYVNLLKISCVVPFISVSDASRLEMLKIVNKNRELPLPFRTWELFEGVYLPAGVTTGQFIYLFFSFFKIEGRQKGGGETRNYITKLQVQGRRGGANL